MLDLIMKIESQRRYRTFLIVLVYLIMAMMGIRLGYYQNIPKELGYVYAIALSLVLTQICIVDSRIVGKPLSIFSYWLIFWFYHVSVPICIIRARGKFGLVIVVAHFIGLMLIQAIFSFLTRYLVFSRFL